MPGRHAAESVRRSQIIKAAYHVAAARGLGGLTVRRVAAKAGVSAGLVLFHFETKEQVVIALLDWLLETTTVLHVGDEIARIASPLDRLLALLRQEMNRLSSEPERIRLFFDFWARGIRHPGIRAKMWRELARYRDAFRPMAEEVLRAAPERFRGVTGEGLAAVAVSFIKGCAVQSMIDPQRFNIAEYLAATDGLVGQLAENSQVRRLRPTRPQSHTV
jgi:TetR/AcrR family transcriptional regulator, transcriptional repressor of bet genes